VADYEAQQKEKWLGVASTWNETPAPASPSAQDLELFAELAQERLPGTGHRVMVLGSTPGLRRVFASLTSVEEVVCVDFLVEMYNAATPFVPFDLRRKERFIEASWLSHLPGVRDVSVAVGDKSLDNVAVNDWGRFFRVMHESLCADGVLILHVGLIDLSLRRYSFDEVVARWEEVASRRGSNLDECASSLWEDLLTASASGQDAFVSIGRFQSELEAAAATSPLIRRLLELFGDSLDDWWARFDMEDLREHADRGGFSIGRVAYAADYPQAGLQPVVSLHRS
jgi:hypothetical protein